MTQKNERVELLNQIIVEQSIEKVSLAKKSEDLQGLLSVLCKTIMGQDGSYTIEQVSGRVIDLVETEKAYIELSNTEQGISEGEFTELSE